MIDFNGYLAYYKFGFGNVNCDGNNSDMAELYLQKYFISEEEYRDRVLRLQETVFNINCEGLLQMVFRDSFQFIISPGDCLFIQEDFETLQSCLNSIGESYFYVIENQFTTITPKSPLPPILRMKFPIDISWEELNSGSFISEVLIKTFYKDYFIFGDYSYWGRYCASNYISSFDITGVIPEVTPLFRDKLLNTDMEHLECVDKYLPQVYKDRMVK